MRAEMEVGGLEMKAKGRTRATTEKPAWFASGLNN